MYNYSAVIRPGKISNTYDIVITVGTPKDKIDGLAHVIYHTSANKVPLHTLIAYMKWKFPPYMRDRKFSAPGHFLSVDAPRQWLVDFIKVEFNFHLGNKSLTHQDENFWPHPPGLVEKKAQRI